MLGLMVETEHAIARVEEIMRVPGVSFVLIAPSDLRIDVKAHGHDASHHEKLVVEVAEASRRTGIPAGYVTRSNEEARKRVDQGFRFINYRSDNGALIGALRQSLADSKEWS